MAETVGKPSEIGFTDENKRRLKASNGFPTPFFDGFLTVPFTDVFPTTN